MSKEKDVLIEEYKALNSAVEARCSNVLLLDSIMIPSSLALVSFAVTAEKVACYVTLV